MGVVLGLQLLTVFFSPCLLPGDFISFAGYNLRNIYLCQKADFLREKITFCIHMCTYIYDCVLGVVLAVDILRLKGRELKDDFQR